MLEDWSDESLYWHLMAMRWSPVNERRVLEQNARFVPAPVRPLAKPVLRRLVGRLARAQGLGRLSYELLLAEFGNRPDDLASLLGESTFFCSEQPSVADFSIHGMFSTGCAEGITPDFAEQVSKRPAPVDWRKRVEDAMHPALP